MSKSQAPVCDVCGGALRKAPFSSTILQNVWICSKEQRHIFRKQTVVGDVVEFIRISSGVAIGILATVTLVEYGTEVFDISDVV